MTKKSEKKPMDIGTKVAKIAKAIKSKEKAQKAAEKRAAAEGRAEGRRIAERLQATGRPDQKPAKPMSGLDAAALVLAEANTGMTAKAIVEAIKERGLGSGLRGKTPHATIYAAMITEIGKKGKDSRFARGSAKGLFVAA